MNQSPGRVAAEQRALRTAQDFDPLKVEKLRVAGAHGADVRIVDVERDRRLKMIGEVILRDAADDHGGQRRVKLNHVQARRLGRQINGVGHAELADLFARKRGDRDANVLSALLAFLGGHENLLQQQILGSGDSAETQHCERPRHPCEKASSWMRFHRPSSLVVATAGLTVATVETLRHSSLSVN